MRITYVIVLIFFMLPIAFAHGDATVWQELGIQDPIAVLYVGSAISFFFLLHALLFRKKMRKDAKKISFIAISVPIIVVTLYLSFSTVYLNAASASGGPVHWHADFEVWACGEKSELVDPSELENKVGEPTVHEHNDNRIHIEGVLLHLEDASLGEFFESVGGEFTKDFLSIPTNEGIKSWRNGDLCNGKPGKWMMFVNGQFNDKMGEYIISPFGTVPPGDEIKIVFSEKPADKINTKLFEVP